MKTNTLTMIYMFTTITVVNVQLCQISIENELFHPILMPILMLRNGNVICMADININHLQDDI